MKIWAARDLDGKLWLYFGKKPSKHVTTWYNNTDDDFCDCPEDLPSVKWKDEEPTEVYFDRGKLKIRRK